MKRLFAPFGILAGLGAGIAARKLFERLWALIDREDPPDPEDHDISMPKFVAALLLEGAVFSLVKGLVNRGARVGFASTTGRWPGNDGEG